MRTLPTALMLIGLISPLPTYAQLSLQQLQQQAYQLDPQLQYLIRQNETDNLRVQQSGRLANPEIAIQADNLGNASLKDLDGIMLFSLIRLLCNKAFYQRYIPVKRIVVDRVGEVQRIVGGFPFVFLIDGDFTSPGIDVLPDLKDGDSSHERLTSQTENVRGRVNIAVMDCTAIHALPLSYS